MHKDKLPQCRICAVPKALVGVPNNLVHCQADRGLRRVLKQRNLGFKVVKNVPNRGVVLRIHGVCAWGAEKPWQMSRGLAALEGPPPWFTCIKAGFSLVSAHSGLQISWVFSYPFLHPKRLKNSIFHHFLHRFSSDHQIQQDPFMDALGAYSYNTLVKLKRETSYEKKLRRWWSSFSCGDRAFI